MAAAKSILPERGVWAWEQWSQCPLSAGYTALGNITARREDVSTPARAIGIFSDFRAGGCNSGVLNNLLPKGSLAPRTSFCTESRNVSPPLFLFQKIAGNLLIEKSVLRRFRKSAQIIIILPWNKSSPGGEVKIENRYEK